GGRHRLAVGSDLEHGRGVDGLAATGRQFTGRTRVGQLAIDDNPNGKARQAVARVGIVEHRIDKFAVDGRRPVLRCHRSGRDQGDGDGQCTAKETACEQAVSRIKTHFFHHQKSYCTASVYARPRGSATRGSQPAPLAQSFLCAVNGGSSSSWFFRPKVKFSLSKPEKLAL